MISRSFGQLRSTWSAVLLWRAICFRKCFSFFQGGWLFGFCDYVHFVRKCCKMHNCLADEKHKQHKAKTKPKLNLDPFVICRLHLLKGPGAFSAPAAWFSTLLDSYGAGWHTEGPEGPERWAHGSQSSFSLAFASGLLQRLVACFWSSQLPLHSADDDPS